MGLPKYIWMLALEAAVPLYNRTPHSGMEFNTPLIKLNPEYQFHLDRHFGSITYVDIPLSESNLPNEKFEW